MSLHWVQYLMSGCCRADGQYGTRVLSRRHSLCVIVPWRRYHQEKNIIPGDVVVYNLKGQPIPIVHRVLTVQEKYLYFDEELMETCTSWQREITTISMTGDFIQEANSGFREMSWWERWSSIFLKWGCLQFGSMITLGSSIPSWDWWVSLYLLRKIHNDTVILSTIITIYHVPIKNYQVYRCSSAIWSKES